MRPRSTFSGAACPGGETAFGDVWIGGRCRLLVSVASAGEIGAAVQGGAHVLDVKDPRRGSLGPAEPEVVRLAVRAAPAGVLVTAALGDGPWSVGLEDAATDLAERLLAAGAWLLKVGLAGLTAAEAGERLRGLRRRIEARTGTRAGLVAVGFADDRRADPLAGRWLATAAAESGLSGAMIDTLSKGRSVLALRGIEELRGWAAGVRSGGLLCGLAGSLALPELPLAATVGSDVIGVRGAVCVGGRAGRVSAARVRRARSALRRAAAPASEFGPAVRPERPAWS